MTNPVIDPATDLLFTPARLGSLAIANRFVRSATAERLSDESGVPGRALAEMYERLAAGEVGLIVGGHAYVDRRGKCHPEMTAIDRDAVVPHLRRVTDAAHAVGTKVALQINFGGAGCDPTVTPLRLVPSLVGPEMAEGGHHALTDGETSELISRYADAARRVREAGYDAVQVHGAHGYLVSQFLSPLRNQRSDGWGGDIAGRSRFLREIGRAIRAAVGPDYPLLVKLGARDYDAGGLTPEDGLWVIARLREWGFDGVEISHGIGGPKREADPTGTPAEREAPFLGLARAAREVTDLPIILVNGLRSAAAMREVVSSGAADFVALCRPLIAEPDLPQRIRLGEASVAKCRTCGRCWPERLGQGAACRNDALAANRG